MNFRTLGVVLAIAALPACSAGPSNESARGTDPGDPSGAGGGQEYGYVGLKLMLPSGQSIEVVDWKITGPNSATTVVQSGTVNSQSSGVSLLVGNIPAGNGYLIALSGTAVDGSVTCSGSAPFNVAVRATTSVSIQLACAVASNGAHVTRINGSSYDCAALSSVSASPTETTVGGIATVSGMANGPVPGALTYGWSAPTGSFDSPTAATTKFTCTAGGPVTLTLVVGDGPVPAGESCSSALSVKTLTIACDIGVQPPPAPAVPRLGLLAMAAALLGIGCFATRRRQTT